MISGWCIYHDLELLTCNYNVRFPTENSVTEKFKICDIVCKIFRTQSRKLLEGKQNGTFLCRPTGKQTTIGRAAHTHTVDIQ